MAELPKIEAVAFDCDGLMFNTEESFNVAGRELLRRRGHELTPGVLRLMMGRRAVEAFEAMISHLNLTDPPDVLQTEYEQLFREALEGRLKIMPGLLDLLAMIERRGLPKAVCTSSERPYLERILGRFDLTTRFEATLTAEDVTHGKPHPEIYLAAAERLGVRPERMLVLEDSENGTKAAVAAGAVAVSVPHEHSASQDFASAWLIADGLADPRVTALVEGKGSCFVTA
ncbi:MAG: HAD family phosphatase [Planctomycetota bacterium]|nr:HAD family phosphatase [Planctomycetaceae bacterium]MDQ3329836.1 HAD family phosphatase [Planctomycetota bacterium]